MSEDNADVITMSYMDIGGIEGLDADDDGYFGGGRGHVLQRQSVTFTARMWPEPTASPPRGWRVPSDRLPILAAVFCGAALVVCVLFALIVYRCCIMPRKEKHYCLRKIEGGTGSGTTQVPMSGAAGAAGGGCSGNGSGNVPTPHYPNQTAVYAEPKGCGWGYSNRIVAANPLVQGQWLRGGRLLGGPQCTQCPGVCPVPRSSSNPGPSQGTIPNISSTSSSSTSGLGNRRQRPVSQPVGLSIINGDTFDKQAIQMPEISEFSTQNIQYASSSILDEVCGKDESSGTSATLKTRSLPAWVRSKPRPLSTEDDLNDLYAKVNFSKKRKNRMRNDEAAIIALSKSRSQFLHKDTDSLVDNEAVIVYDERTAL